MSRVITEHDRENAQRLKAIWMTKKHHLKLTQEDLAKLMGINRAAVSQYLNCFIALNTDAILKFSQALKISPIDIDPTLTALATTPSQSRAIRVPTYAKLSGELPGPHEVVEVMAENSLNLYAVAVDTEGFAPFARRGSTLLVSPTRNRFQATACSSP